MTADDHLERPQRRAVADATSSSPPPAAEPQSPSSLTAQPADRPRHGRAIAAAPPPSPAAVAAAAEAASVDFGDGDDRMLVDADQKEALLVVSPAGNGIEYQAQPKGHQVTAEGLLQPRVRKSHFTSSFYKKTKRRVMFKNGDFNIALANISKLRRRYMRDLFTTLVDARWRWTLFVFCMSFLLSWFGCGVVWYLIAYTHGDLLPENAGNAHWSPCVINMQTFVASFLFSVETQHTTGFGYRMVTEECPEAIVFFCFQSIAGLMIQAFMVGIVFAKMARPKQRSQTLIFSKNAVICRRDGYLCFMFRVGDMRVKSHLIGATIRTRLIRSRVTPEGEVLTPDVTHLKMTVDEHDEQVFLMWPALVVHRIDRDSPLYGLSAAGLLTDRFEVAVVLEGTTESTGQTTQARTSYVASEVLWGHRFRPLVRYCKTKLTYEVDYSLFHDVCKVDTPLCSARDLETYFALGGVGGGGGGVGVDHLRPQHQQQQPWTELGGDVVA